MLGIKQLNDSGRGLELNTIPLNLDWSISSICLRHVFDELFTAYRGKTLRFIGLDFVSDVQPEELRKNVYERSQALRRILTRVSSSLYPTQTKEKMVTPEQETG